MIFEFIATITAGFGMAGLALIFSKLLKPLGFKAPKWLIPLFASIGILAFQIHQEYHWHQQTIDQLPKHIKVVKLVESQVWYRPWSYIKPQVVRFMAVNNTVPSSLAINRSRDIKVVDIYLFERRISPKVIRQHIDCRNATYTASEQPEHTSETMSSDASDWHSIGRQEALFIAVCREGQ